jgi:hypothetical protein
MSVLQGFCEKVESRGKYGVPWATIITVLLPVVLECFKTPRQMESAAKSPTALQKVGLRLRVRRELQKTGKFRLFQLAPVVDDLTEAVLAQAKEEAESQLMQGDVWADAFEEAKELAG